MDTYYQILGLEPNASQEEIKRAYFKKIRQFSPESDPEQFQKIREAYELLKDAKNAPQGPSFPPPSEPFAAKMLAQIQTLRQTKDHRGFRDTCAEAWHLFPNDVQFLYLLVIAQRLCGNTGNAVKNAELLVKKDPDNKWYWRELAVSYMERGYTQKAYPAFEKAYELGCRDNDFILMFARECNDYGQYDQGTQILLEIINREHKWTKEEMPDLVETYIALLVLQMHTDLVPLPEILEKLYLLLDKYRIYLEDYLQEFSMALTQIGIQNGCIPEIYQKLQDIFALMRKMCHTDSVRTDINNFWEIIVHKRIMDDTRIGETLKQGFETFMQLEELEYTLKKYAITDVQLCMIEERNEILEQAEIIKQEYPTYYEQISEFIQKLKDEKNLPLLKEELLKTYRRLSQECSGGFYYKKYPHEQKQAYGTVIHDNADNTPYIKTQPKIGRNDPCPCGSGKKYKHCCLKTAK